MKKIVKTILFILTIFLVIFNLSILAMDLIMINIVKASLESYWLRELYFVGPFIISIIPILSFLGFLISLSILFSFKENQKSALSNLIKYIIANILATISLALLLFQINKAGDVIYGKSDASFLGIIKKFKLNISNVIVFIFAVSGYIWVYLKEKNNSKIKKIKNKSNKIFTIIFIIFSLIILGFFSFGFFQSRLLNPNIKEISSKVEFPIYGFIKKSNYIWSLPLFYNNEKISEVRGVISLKSDRSNLIIISEHKELESDTEEIEKFIEKYEANENNFEFNGEKIIGAEFNNQSGSVRGNFLWRTGKGTNIFIQGVIGGDYNWESIIKEIIENFGIIK